MATMHTAPIVPASGPGTVLSVTPGSAGWRFLSFAVVELAPGGAHRHLLGDQETATVVLAGAVDAAFGHTSERLTRRSVFAELAPVVYVPPGTELQLTAGTEGATVAIGSAPARGHYPARIIEPSVIRSEVRGGGAATRQVNHTLAPPLEAERLIVYEVYVPRGTWSGWPPHCHDGRDGSPYLEETYYFRLDRPEGFWMHRNWVRDGSFDETIVGGDGQVALVPQGYHSSVACPGANMYFLNFLAGDLVDDQRRTPPCFHPEHTWIEHDWHAGDAGAWPLPVVTNGDAGT